MVRRPTQIVIAICAIAGAMLYAWYGLKLRYSYFPKRFAVVETDAIYRSGQIHRRIIQSTLVKHQIEVVVDLSLDDPADIHETAERQAVQELGIDKHDIGGVGGEGVGDIQAYADAIEAITEARRQDKRVLVHCMAGAQRTGGVIALYRVLVQTRPAEDAYRELIQGGHRPDRNPHLIPFLNDNMERLAVLLVESQVIEQVPDPIPIIGLRPTSLASSKRHP